MCEMADDMTEGFACSGCGIFFNEPHGFPVYCQDCYADIPENERANSLACAWLPGLCDEDEEE